MLSRGRREGDGASNTDALTVGGFRAHLDPGVPLAFPTRKAQALLAYVAMPPGRPSPRQLASLLWASTVETTARTSLRQTLYALRRSLQRADGEPLMPTAIRCLSIPAL